MKLIYFLMKVVSLDIAGYRKFNICIVIKNKFYYTFLTYKCPFFIN